MVKNLLDSYNLLRSYLSLKCKNVVKFYVHISPIFSCHVTYIVGITGACAFKRDGAFTPKLALAPQI